MTRRLFAGPDGAGGISEPQAVDAVNVWRERQPQVLVSTPLPLAGATPVIFAQMTTTSLAGGEYKINATLLSSGTNSGTTIKVELGTFGVPSPGLFGQFSIGSSTSRPVFTGSASLALPPGIATVEIFVSQPISPGTASAEVGIIQLERVA